MGGVIRTGKASRILRNSTDAESLFIGEQEIWRKPIPSILPAQVGTPTDNVLFFGSSDLGGLASSTWSPRDHNWGNTLRTNYAGSLYTPSGPVSVGGVAWAVTYGRQKIMNLMANAANGQYGTANPLTYIQDYDILVLDYADVRNRSGSINDHPQNQTYPEYHHFNILPPFAWREQNYNFQFVQPIVEYLNIIRHAYANGVRKFYMTMPWARLEEYDGRTQEERDLKWRQVDANIEMSMHFIQDRINHEMKLEGMEAHINLIPLGLITRELYDDVVDGLNPPSLTSYRSLFALDNSGDNTTDRIDPSQQKHVYMQNYVGTYANNLLYHAIVFDIDPLTAPETDGFYTVPSDAAAYIKNKVATIVNTYARAGKTRTEVGWRQPKVIDSSPQDIAGSKLLFHQATPIHTNQTVMFPTAGMAATVMSVVRVPSDLSFYYEMFIRGAMTDSSHSLIINSNPTNVRYYTNMLSFHPGVDGDGHAMGDVSQNQNEDFNYLCFVLNYPVNDWIDIQTGYNTRGEVYNMDIDPIPEFDVKGVGSMTNNWQNRTVPMNRITFAEPYGAEEVVVFHTHLEDHERFNMLRYFSKKYQRRVLEPLWPGMVE